MKKLATLAVLQLGVILGWAGYQEHVRAHAPTFRIPLQPVDPYDVLRGRYFVLNPLDSQLRTGQPATHLTTATVERFLGPERGYSGPVWIGFCPVADVHRVCDLRRKGAESPVSEAGRFWSPARSVVWQAVTFRDGQQVPEPGWHVTLNLDLERFFLPNRFPLPGHERDSGWELEVSHRAAQPLLPRRLWFRGAPVRTER